MGDFAELDWPPPQGALAGVPLGYDVERRLTTPIHPTAPFTRIAVRATNSVGYRDTDVDFTPVPLIGLAYQYRVRAVYADDVTGPSNTDSVSIPFAPPGP